MAPEPGFNHPPANPNIEPIQHAGKTIRAIAIDIDGTITDMRRRLDWNAISSLRAAEQRGIAVILATGNVIPATKTYASSIGTSAPIVCENGGTVYWERPRDDGKGSHIHKAVLKDRASADQVVAALQKDGHPIRLITSDPWRESEAALEYTVEPELVRDYAERAPDDALTVVATGFAIHILSRELDKYHGLAQAIEWLNTFDPRFSPELGGTELSRDHILAIGDSMNDHMMIDRCGLGAAVGNAKQPVKDVADLIVDEPHGAGVRRILDTVGVQTDAPYFS